MKCLKCGKNIKSDGSETLCGKCVQDELKEMGYQYDAKFDLDVYCELCDISICGNAYVECEMCGKKVCDKCVNHVEELINDNYTDVWICNECNNEECI